MQFHMHAKMRERSMTTDFLYFFNMETVYVAFFHKPKKKFFFF